MPQTPIIRNESPKRSESVEMKQKKEKTKMKSEFALNARAHTWFNYSNEYTNAPIFNLAH